ncbi:MAG: FhaA domain-containing protein [Candidatus Xenobia bacterium]
MQLKELERRLRELVRGHGRGRVHPLEVARALADAMVAQARSGMAPNRFNLLFHPGEVLEEGQELLSDYLMAEAQQRELRWAGPIVLSFCSDAAVPPGTVRATAQADALPPPDWRDSTQVLPMLLVEDGFGVGKLHPVRVPTCLLGRGAQCDVRIGDPKVSHQHALIRFDGGRFLLEDLQSSNGTTVNGEAVGEGVSLQDGDRIGCGWTILRFQGGSRRGWGKTASR